ncbi:uncharacterized protein BX664DRAFT_333301 [Halteromyces radiatus]|uniref:uncharacterized protein n=1 Tax=Halteromyces radiatus TaxID=101107 RepID=UPI00221FCFC5|nr:uncharacterized protein BX664DRAFT_333301 [Halteromyces radiatus]KAI8089546.1 hypothetical protein BX664DRAFT_333301 [Halteromyces radiatus]
MTNSQHPHSKDDILSSLGIHDIMQTKEIQDLMIKAAQSLGELPYNHCQLQKVEEEEDDIDNVYSPLDILQLAPSPSATSSATIDDHSHCIENENDDISTTHFQSLAIQQINQMKSTICNSNLLPAGFYDTYITSCHMMRTIQQPLWTLQENQPSCMSMNSPWRLSQKMNLLPMINVPTISNVNENVLSLLSKDRVQLCPETKMDLIKLSQCFCTDSIYDTKTPDLPIPALEFDTIQPIRRLYNATIDGNVPVQHEEQHQQLTHDDDHGYFDFDVISSYVYDTTINIPSISSNDKDDNINKNHNSINFGDDPHIGAKCDDIAFTTKSIQTTPATALTSTSSNHFDAQQETKTAYTTPPVFSHYWSSSSTKAKVPSSVQPCPTLPSISPSILSSTVSSPNLSFQRSSSTVSLANSLFQPSRNVSSPVQSPPSCLTINFGSTTSKQVPLPMSSSSYIQNASVDPVINDEEDTISFKSLSLFDERPVNLVEAESNKDIQCHMKESSSEDNNRINNSNSSTFHGKALKITEDKRDHLLPQYHKDTKTSSFPTSDTLPDHHPSLIAENVVASSKTSSNPMAPSTVTSAAAKMAHDMTIAFQEAKSSSSAKTPLFSAGENLIDFLATRQWQPSSSFTMVNSSGLHSNNNKSTKRSWCELDDPRYLQSRKKEQWKWAKKKTG